MKKPNIPVSDGKLANLRAKSFSAALTLCRVAALARSPKKRLGVMLLYLGMTGLVNASANPVFAATTAPTSFSQLLKPVMWFVSAILLVMGMIFIGQGWTKISQGEQGVMQIVGGIGCILAIPIAWIVYSRSGGEIERIEPNGLD